MYVTLLMGQPNRLKRELTILDILFAIGAYYTSFPRASSAHEHYFHRALALSKVAAGHRSINRVSFLLAECFYLLAVCKTDRFATSSKNEGRISRKLILV